MTHVSPKSDVDRPVIFEHADEADYAAFLARVVSRRLWKFPGGLLRVCEIGAGYAARSSAIGPSG